MDRDMLLIPTHRGFDITSVNLSTVFCKNQWFSLEIEQREDAYLVSISDNLLSFGIKGPEEISLHKALAAAAKEFYVHARGLYTRINIEISRVESNTVPQNKFAAYAVLGNPIFSPLDENYVQVDVADIGRLLFTARTLSYKGYTIVDGHVERFVPPPVERALRLYNNVIAGLALRCSKIKECFPEAVVEKVADVPVAVDVEIEVAVAAVEVAKDGPSTEPWSDVTTFLSTTPTIPTDTIKLEDVLHVTK